MAGPAPLAVVHGYVRSAEPVTRNNDNGVQETFAVRASILTEPNGGFLDVTIWPADIKISEALACVGQEVEWVCGFSAWAGRNGGAGVQANFIADIKATQSAAN